MATKRKLAKVAEPVKQNIKLPTSTRIDESRTAVSAPGTHQTETIEISSDSESNYDDLSDLEDDQEPDGSNQQTELQRPSENDGGNPKLNGENGDTEMTDAAQNGDDSDAEPTFGDLVRNNETVDVAATLDAQQSAGASTALTAIPPRQIAPPSTSSIGTVLAQALRTDDADLLESCLHTSDTNVIRNTIQRLDSNLAGTLLTQLAARLHRRPGRAHNLMSYVQWTLIAHGGALATQPDIQKRLVDLNRVLEERSRGLNSLLALKGKLDMLEAQMTLRRGNKTRAAALGGGDSEDDDEVDQGEEGIVYVEGQEDETLANDVAKRRDDDDEDLPVPNGVASDSEDDSDDEDQDDMDVDEFAEESLDEDEVDHDDVEEDSAEEDESETEAAPPAKMQKKSKSFARR